MSVKSVWGRIQGYDAVLTAQEGNTWIFQVPPWATSPIIVEIWAEDEAGNVSYKTGVFDLDEGAIKCIKWRDTGATCIMLGNDKPSVSIDLGRPAISYEDHVCIRVAMA